MESGRRGDVSEVKEHYWRGGAKVFLRRKRERDRDSFAWRRGLSQRDWERLGRPLQAATVAGLLPSQRALGADPSCGSVWADPSRPPRVSREHLGSPIQAPKRVAGAPHLSSAAGAPFQVPQGCRGVAPRSRHAGAPEQPLPGSAPRCLGALLPHALGKSGVAERERGRGVPWPRVPAPSPHLPLWC